MKLEELNLTQEWDKTFPKSDAYANMIKDSKYAGNKELLIIPGAVHTDLYDGGGKGAIPFDKLQAFFAENLQ